MCGVSEHHTQIAAGERPTVFAAVDVVLPVAAEPASPLTIAADQGIGERLTLLKETTITDRLVIHTSALRHDPVNSDMLSDLCTTNTVRHRQITRRS